MATLDEKIRACFHSEFFLFGRMDRFFRPSELRAGARFDFNEPQASAFFNNRVDLSDFTAEIFFQDPKALFAEVFAGRHFSALAQRNPEGCFFRREFQGAFPVKGPGPAKNFCGERAKARFL